MVDDCPQGQRPRRARLNTTRPSRTRYTGPSRTRWGLFFATSAQPPTFPARFDARQSRGVATHHPRPNHKASPQPRPGARFSSRCSICARFQTPSGCFSGWEMGFPPLFQPFPARERAGERLRTAPWGYSPKNFPSLRSGDYPELASLAPISLRSGASPSKLGSPWEVRAPSSALTDH